MKKDKDAGMKVLASFKCEKVRGEMMGRDDSETVFLSEAGQGYIDRSEELKIQPRLFVCFEHEIMEFVLSGRQMIGRPFKNIIPDIPVTNRYVSRCHGYFDTIGNKVTYTAAETKNGTVFRRKKLEPNETVELWDGDELIIPTSANDDSVDIMLVCAIVENRINIWRDLRLSARDALTGLSGRNTFRTWYLMNYGWERETAICLFILDIDHFKSINDVYGHSAGDNALKVLSEQLLLTVGSNGYVCRWGGDEFVGIIVGTENEAEASLNIMRNRIGSIRVDDQFNMTISVGVIDVRNAREAKDVDNLVVLADQALYKAKEGGRNRICVV